MKPEYILADHSSRYERYPAPARGVIQSGPGGYRGRLPDLARDRLPPPQARGTADIPYEDHIKIYFEHGIRLPDPHGVLEGDGRQTRYVRVQSAKDVRRQP